MMIKIEKPNAGPETQSFDNGEAEWRVSDLIFNARNLEVMEIPLEHLNFAQDRIGGTYVREFVSHMKAVMDADLSYPIILSEDGEIMDGRHRLAKALFEGKETIKAVRFETTPTPTRYLDDEAQDDE